MPTLDHSILEAIAAQLQPILLGYRLQNYGEVLMHFHSDVPDFTPRTKAIARALGAPLLGDETLKRRLYANLLLQDKEAILNRQGEPEYAVAIALYRRSHFGESYFTMTELAELVSVVLSEIGETFTLHPRAVGALVRALGFHSEKLGSQGRGIRMTSGFKRKAHEIARDLGIVRSDIVSWLAVEGGYGGYACSLCEEMGLMVRSNDGKPLRTMTPAKPRRCNLYERQEPTSLTPGTTQKL